MFAITEYILQILLLLLIEHYSEALSDVGLSLSIKNELLFKLKSLYSLSMYPLQHVLLYSL
jgi:hypothetical protein